MAPAPGDKARNVIVHDLGQQRGWAEIVDQAGEVAPRVTLAGVVLTDLGPIPARHVVELQRCRRGFGSRRRLLRELALGLLYPLGFALVRSLRRAVKAITSPPEVEVVERRALRPVD